MMKKRRTFSFSSLILSRISWCLVVIFSVWGVWFYWAIINEINDETDDALEDYSETLIVRSLSGEALPTRSDASNNQFYLRPLPYRDIPLEERIRYKDSMVYIPKKREHEPARILTTVFVDGHGNLQELTVLTPTIEKKDLREAILFWIVVLYVLLLLAVLSVNIWVLNRGMRPLRVLLRWLDEYRIGGRHNKPLDNETRVIEFRKLNEAAQRHTQRNERLYEEQKEFIGNASHEMQTPLAICQSRLEMLLEDETLSEEQLSELLKLRDTIERMIRQNRSLLLLSKIENEQFGEAAPQNLNALLRKYCPDYEEVYAYKQISLAIEERGELEVEMNASLAATMLTNLLKNAYVHTPEHGAIHIYISSSTLWVCNTAAGGPLDGAHVFDRFWHSSKREGSTGLGLSIVRSICRLYGLHIRYEYRGGDHCFRLSKEGVE